MKQKSALFQLIGEEAMPNLAAMLALRPEHVIHLATPSTRSRSESLHRVGQQFKDPPEFHSVSLSAMPTIAEARAALSESIQLARKRALLPVVNFTGGTKLMSIGAHQAAREAQVPSFYVDTGSECFHDGETAPGLAALLPSLGFQCLRETLAVHHIAVANGCERVTGGLDTGPYEDLAHHLLQKSDDEKATWEAIHGPSGLCPQGREPRRPADWIALLGRPLRLTPEVASLALKAGLLAGDPASPRVLCHEMELLKRLARNEHPPAAECFRASRQPQRTLAFLSGGWWEVIVAAAARKSGRFRDVRWSVDAGQRGPGGSVEEDVVAVDGIRLAHFSCKRGGLRSGLFRALEEESVAATRLGGRFARKHLCIYLPTGNMTRMPLERRARELQARLLWPEDLQRDDCFKP